MSDIDIDINSLTEDQKLAVQTESQFLFVSAGPGSGKTRVLTLRVFEKLVKKLLAGPPSKSSFPSNFVITFTNKAARELNHRINALIAKHLNCTNPRINHLQDPRLSKIFVGTFHALGLKILSRFSNVLYNQRLSIIAKSDCSQLFKLAAEKVKAKASGKIDDGTKKSLKKMDMKFDSETFFSILRIFKQTSNNHKVMVENIYDLYNNERYKKVAEQYMNENSAKLNKDSLSIEFLVDEYYKVYLEFIGLMQQGKFMDFDDLLQYSVHTLCHLGLRHDLQIENIYVDEFQDTNELQLELLVKMRNYSLKYFGNPTITLVGDQDQTIFSWRNYTLETAESDSPDDILQNLNGSVWHKVRLEKNFRSTDKIIVAANNVIQFDTSREGRSQFINQPKSILVDHPQPTGPLVVLHTEEDEQDEGKFIVKQIRQMREKAKKLGADFKLSDIAILTRAGFMAEPVINHLNREGIPYQGIGKSIWETKFVLDLLSYLKALYNPNDVPSIQRSCNTPSRGLGPASTSAIATLDPKGEPLLHYLLKLAKVSKPSKASNLTPEEKKLLGKAGMKKYLATMQALSDAYEAESMKLLDLVTLVAELSGLRESLEEDERRKRGDEEEASKLTQLKQLVVQLMDDGGKMQLKDMVKLLIEASGLNMDGFEKSKRDAVNVLTIHSAKGLEWPIVFVIAVQDGCIPFFRAKEEDKINEEVRLLYVGITRCKYLLYLTSAYTRPYSNYTFNPQRYKYLKDLTDHCRAIEPPTFTTKFFTELATFLKRPLKSTKVEEDTDKVDLGAPHMTTKTLKAEELDRNEVDLVTPPTTSKNIKLKELEEEEELNPPKLETKEFGTFFQSALSMLKGVKQEANPNSNSNDFSPYIPTRPKTKVKAKFTPTKPTTKVELSIKHEIVDLTDSPVKPRVSDTELLDKFTSRKKFKSERTKQVL